MMRVHSFLSGISLLGVTVMALVASVVTVHAENAGVPEAPTIRPVMTQIAGETVDAAHDYIGMISARVEVDLGFPVSGTIATRRVSLGDTVQQGDILAQMDPEALDAGAWAARAGVVVATNQLASARDAMQREQTLVERGVENQSRLEDAERAFAATKARMAQAQADLARAEDLLRSATLHAPFNGVITFVMAEAGAAVSTGQAVVRLASANEREVVIDLSEAELASLPEDTTFEAQLLAVQNASTTIRVQSIDPVADSHTRTRRVHFSLVDPSPDFRIGALVRVKTPRSGVRAIMVPTSAILRSDGGTYVLQVVRPDGIVHRLAVTLGPDVGDNRVLITSGIEIGQEIVTKGIHSIKDGQIVGPRVHR